MEIDHIFMFIEPNGPELDQLKALGLVETYRRQHPGQGTANVCFAFDNMFVELLWMVDPVEALSPPIVRTGLEPRSRWRTAGTCPFGIAWRGDYDDAIETWDFAPPYMPEGVSIEVAIDSDDPLQPMMFTFPGSKAPLSWDSDRKGELQNRAGFQTIDRIVMTLPEHVPVTPSLSTLLRLLSPNLSVRYGSAFRLQLILNGTTKKVVSFPTSKATPATPMSHWPSKSSSFSPKS
jgi:hypothetical protein